MLPDGIGLSPTEILMPKICCWANDRSSITDDVTHTVNPMLNANQGSPTALVAAMGESPVNL
jgi:hypothetical protein